MSSDAKDTTSSKVVDPSSESSPKEAVKRKSEGSEEVVHSANDWEHANLGDGERKNKFLRLMGAGKKDHQGKIVIGDKEAEPHKHARAAEETDEITDKLEQQYKESLEFKLSGNARRHKGLGFHGEEGAEPARNKPETVEDSKGFEPPTESSDNSASKKEESKTDNDGPSAPKKPMLMNFVKSSS